MRFSDIKKFWETRLGGQISKSSQATCSGSTKNTRKKSSSSSTKRQPVLVNNVLDNESCQQSDVTRAKNKMSGDSQFHDDVNVISVEASNADTWFSVHSPVINGSQTEDNRKAIEAETVVCSSRESNQKKIRSSSFTSALKSFNRKGSEKLAAKPENFCVNEHCTFVTSSAKVTLISNLISSDPDSEEASVRPVIQSKIDSTSAPASVSNSPRKAMQQADSRYHFRNNVKFSEVQNFWMIREKKLCQKYMDERRCVACGRHLNDYFYEFNETLYCEEDFWEKFGHRCKKCAGVITGPIIIAGQHRFHPECFSCQCCKRCLSDGDLYALLLFKSKQDLTIEDTSLFCLCCYEGLLSDYSSNSNEEDTVEHCTVIQVVEFIPSAPDVIPCEEDAESSVQHIYGKGYGLVLKSLSMNLSTDGSNQPVGQIICAISDKNSCLAEGDVLLQINGQTVDSNAIDLIERLEDNCAKPLLLTIQREVIRPAKLCFKSHNCSHFQTVDRTTEDVKHAPAVYDRAVFDDTENVMHSSSSILPIDDQPRSPVVAVDDHPEHFNLSPANVDSRLPMTYKASSNDSNDATALYCSPFSSFGSQSLCCDAIVIHKMNSEVVETENKVNGEGALSDAEINETANNLLTDSGYATNNGCFSSEFASNVESDSEFFTDQSQNAVSTSSAANDGIFMLEERQRNNVSISVSNTTTSQRCSYRKDNASIIYEDDSCSSASTVFCANGETETSIEISKNSLETLQSISTKHSSADESISDRGSPISPRTKRMAIKRKSIIASEQDSQSGGEPLKTNLLRSDNPVTMRRIAPRNHPQSPRIASVYYTEHAYYFGADLNRSESMRVHGPQIGKCPRVFRSCDLIHGEVLGQGFFGKATKVTHRDTGEVMVLKELNSLDKTVEESFLQEVKVMRKLSHPNVINFIGVFYKDRRLNIITEFVENGTLKDVVTNLEQVLTWRQRVNIAFDIACGMSYLHSKNLIHRDLNSGNCFVKSDGTVIVADFGLARFHSKGEKRYTVVGNPFWMAPEMLRGKQYDDRVDVFSFGIVLCEVIGRIDGNPDFLPRANDFGLDVLEFYEKFCGHCPAFFFAIAVQCSSLSVGCRPSFKVLEEWFHMLKFREAEALYTLPVAPNLHNLIVSVYSQYNLTPPSDFYYPFMKISNRLDVSPNSLNLLSSSTRVESEPTPSDSDLEQDLKTNNGRGPLKSSVRGTEFFSDSSITSRL